MPGRPLEPLVLADAWGVSEVDDCTGTRLDGNDPILKKPLALRPFTIELADDGATTLASPLVSAAAARHRQYLT